MEIRNIAVCMFVLLTTVSSACIPVQEKPQEITARITNRYDRPVQLQIEISCDKYEVALNDTVTFDVKVFNLPIEEEKDDISIFNPLKLGIAGGLTITIVGAKGSEVFPKEVVNQAIQPVIDDSWPYFTLLTYHYVGAIYQDSAKNIFQYPGKYFVFAEYLSPVTESGMKKYGEVQNFWGREIGPIRSASLEINVTR